MKKDRIIFIYSTTYGLDSETYDSPLAMVRSLLNDGRLVNAAWGSEEHVNALREIRSHIDRILPDVVTD